MTKENLIPKDFSKMPNHKEISAKGGRVKSEAKRFMTLLRRSEIAKCKNCKAQCILKESNLAEKKSMICPIPEARGKAIFYDKPVVDEGILERLSHRTLYKMYNLGKDDLNMLDLIHKAILRQKESDFPKIQKSLNLTYAQQVGEITIKWKGEDETES